MMEGLQEQTLAVEFYTAYCSKRNVAALKLPFLAAQCTATATVSGLLIAYRAVGSIAFILA